MKKHWLIVPACLGLAVSLPCLAGGTLDTDELVPLLSQKPAVYAAILDSYELRDSAWAWVRFGDPYPNLAGARLGPYEIEATTKQSHKKVVIVLCTKATYFDAAGRTLSGTNEENATRVTETLTAVMLQDSVVEMHPDCP